MENFENFINAFLKAIKDEDSGFMRKVYGEWFSSSGVVPKDQEDYFFKMIFNELKPVLESRLKRTENYDDYYIAYFSEPDGSESFFTFRKNADGFAFFNERMNFSKFRKVYAISYDVSGGKLRFLFNGKRTPVVTDVDSTSGFVSLINAALKPGDNEITLQSVDGKSLKVSIGISSGEEGGIINSAQGDVLSWDGTVKDPVSLKFKAE